MKLFDARRTLILDLDGTLVDSAVTITSTLNIMRDREQLIPLDIEEVKPFISLGAEKLLKVMLPHQNINIQTKLKISGASIWRRKFTQAICSMVCQMRWSY